LLSEGTGKSVLLREIIQFSGGYASSSLGITASTGIAAVNIGGVTLHSWAGIGIGNETAKNVVGKFFGQAQLFSNVINRWQSVKTLIIDESMPSLLFVVWRSKVFFSLDDRW
jgi:ATP-dependent DNA helicase PIF1